MIMKMSEQQLSVNDLDKDSTADLSATASASAADYNLPPHEDEFLDPSSEDVRGTVVRT